MRFKEYFRQKKISFLLVGLLIIAGLFAIRWLTADVVEFDLPNNIQDLLTVSISVILESLPFVVLGILLSILIQTWLPDDFIIKRLPKNALLRRMAVSLLGMFMPVCECGNIPLARGLIVKGLSVPDSLTFLLAAPILNPITIITTQQAFGGDMTILVARLLGGFLIANIIGWVFSKYSSKKSMLTDNFEAICKQPDTHDHSKKGKARQSTKILLQELNAIMPALFIGAFIAGAIQLLGPREILTVLGADPILSVLAMILLAFIVSICSNVDAFFALAFKSTFTTGAIVSFLTFGPMIDIKMIALMRTTYRPIVIWQIVGLVTLMSILIGLVVNYAF